MADQNMQDPLSAVSKVKNLSPAAAALAGVVIGAGAAMAGSRIFSDKKTREKVKETLLDVKEKIADSMEKAGRNLKEH